MKKLIKLLTLGISLVIISCEGDKGDVGPAWQIGTKGDVGTVGIKGDTGSVGSKGDTGALGAAGTNGTNGTNGSTGTANVIYSEWKSLPYPGTGDEAWTRANFPPADNSSSTFPVFTNYLKASKITCNVIDKGIVMVYFKNQALSPVVYSLPYETYSEGSASGPIVSMMYYFNIREGSISIIAKNLYPTFFTGRFVLPYEAAVFRYVIIPGGVESGKLANIDMKDYEAVKKAYDIPD